MDDDKKTFHERVLEYDDAQKITFLSKKHEYSDVYTFEFKPSKELAFIPGQYADFFMKDLDQNKGKPVRIFSLANTPEENVILSMHTRSGSEFKNRMSEYKEGDTLTLYNIRGNFVLPQEDKDIVFIAGGIGITPVRSMLLSRGTPRHTLVHVSNGEFLYENELKDLDVNQMRVDRPRIASLTRELAREKKEAMFYVSGSPRFVREIKHELFGSGLSPYNFRQDSFDGYDGL